jgi:hypothetical protein
MMDEESRKSLKEIDDEFEKMERDNGRYIVIKGDSFMSIK